MGIAAGLGGDLSRDPHRPAQHRISHAGGEATYIGARFW
jgi:hypothetical protein